MQYSIVQSLCVRFSLSCSNTLNHPNTCPPRTSIGLLSSPDFLHIILVSSFADSFSLKVFADVFAVNFVALDFLALNFFASVFALNFFANFFADVLADAFALNLFAFDFSGLTFLAGCFAGLGTNFFEL